ncbi:FAD-binding oxidoreductase [Trichocoleus sp. FACHB-591]|uniref:NAD(P)/FAD-dependent oxidoreductase n=1 Tax=Trichocoleus sp. FACHB-591 TaxID=2692872 RepID=UPI0016841BBC|nr:FAD-binding oxidoreductase [Trichocoleus sp. FACHB-591]MBD2097520.1 FAD-binding oxidoreductase [Trichocoleus sp. FACHB-591]
MSTYDWIVIGGGVTGAALSYELAQKQFSVLLIEQHGTLQGATRLSYGGIAYWSGTTDLTRQLCQAGWQRYPNLAAELGAEIHFRELDLLLTVAVDRDPTAIAPSYADYVIPPRLLSVAEACDLEPLLNPEAIAGAFTVRHGQVDPEAMTQAYQQAFVRSGGKIVIDSVMGLQRQNQRITGAIATQQIYTAANVVICTGGWSRALLAKAGLTVPLYFTHAELIETPPVDIKLRTLVMTAEMQRFQLEAQASTTDKERQWQQPDTELLPFVLDAGVVQLANGNLRLGQISRVLSNPQAQVDAVASEAAIRESVGQVLPSLQNLPGQWQHCLVAFSRDRLPLIGAVSETVGLHVFSGFSNPFAIVPPLAERFAEGASGETDSILAQLSPARFATPVT